MLFAQFDKVKVSIKGMSCMHCAKRVEDTLSKINGIKEVKVNLQTESAACKIKKGVNIPEDVIKKAIESEGYEFKGMAVE